MSVHILLLSLLPLFPSSPEPTANTIPDRVTVLNTTISITPAGKDRIEQKMRSLTQNTTYFNDYLNRCLVYFPVIEREFQAAGVPTDFKFLSLQESALNGNAVSRSQAVGYWQFKQATAEEYQLRIDNMVDERRNVISASRAAAQYFKKSNHYLNNWMYALLSYNLGLTGAKNYIAQNNLSNSVVVDQDAHQYMVHFLAHYFAFKDAYEQRKSSASYYLVEYAGGVHNSFPEVAQFVMNAQNTGSQNNYVNTLRQYNPWLLTERVPENSAYCFSLVLPVPQNMRQDVVSKLRPYACGGKARGHSNRSFYADSLKNDYPFIVNREDLVETDIYREVLANGVRAVMPKKDVSTKKILKELGVSRRAFRQYNEGMKYKILKSGALYYLTEKPATIPLSYHIVEPGEDLFELAQKYGIQADKLLMYNDLEKPEAIQPGDKLFFNPAQ